MAKNKVQKTISVDPDLAKYIEEGIKSHKFSSWSHGVEWCIARAIDAEK